MEKAQSVDLDRRRREMETFLALADVHRVIGRHLDHAFREQGLDDVTPPQAAVLAVLFEDRVATTSRLAQRLGLADVTVGRFVATLERAGYVTRERNPQDAREQLVRPTPMAYDKLPTFVTLTNEVLDALFADLSDEALRSLEATLHRARARLADDARTPDHRLLPAGLPQKDE